MPSGIIQGRGSLISDLPARAPQNFIINWDKAVTGAIDSASQVIQTQTKMENARTMAQMAQSRNELRAMQAKNVARTLKQANEFDTWNQQNASEIGDFETAFGANDTETINKFVTKWRADPIARSNPNVREYLNSSIDTYRQKKITLPDGKIITGDQSLNAIQLGIREGAQATPTLEDLATIGGKLNLLAQGKDLDLKAKKDAVEMARLSLEDDTVAEAARVFKETGSQRDEIRAIQIMTDKNKAIADRSNSLLSRYESTHINPRMMNIKRMTAENAEKMIPLQFNLQMKTIQEHMKTIGTPSAEAQGRVLLSNLLTKSFEETTAYAVAVKKLNDDLTKERNSKVANPLTIRTMQKQLDSASSVLTGLSDTQDAIVAALGKKFVAGQQSAAAPEITDVSAEGRKPGEIWTQNGIQYRVNPANGRVQHFKQ